MLRLLALTTAFVVPSLALADGEVTGGSESNQNSLQTCYDAWGDHPFQDPAQQTFTYVDVKIRVMGFGSAEYSDEPTSEPVLYLVGLNVNNLTRTTYWLNNPNGWYCFYNNVTVMARQEVRVADGAHIADANDPLAILGSGTKQHSGVVILGAVRVYDQ